MKHKERLCDLMVRRGLAPNSNAAERMILAGKVKVNDEVVTQAKAQFTGAVSIEVRRSKPYVSRGGLKLEGALKDFSFDPRGLRCLDVGASSGGFTDCLLKAGALQVSAVDVGYGQFDWSLRQDSRVVLFERTNIAHVDPAVLKAPFDLLVVDLSFTSLARLAPVLAALVDERGSILALVKPQFELPKASVKSGVVRSFDLHVQALTSVWQAFENAGLLTQEVSYSHIPGPKGNIEFWIWAAKQGTTATIDSRIEAVVRLAHTELLGSENT